MLEGFIVNWENGNILCPRKYINFKIVYFYPIFVVLGN